MSTVLLSGYYGYGNTGDEAVLAGLLAGLRTALPDIRPLVLSGDAKTTATLHEVEALPRRSGWMSLRHTLAKTDVLLSGGGSLLQDVTSWRSPLYYLGVIALAQQMRVPVAFLAQGVGPLQRPLIRRLTRRVLERVQAITVRDTESEALLQQIGVGQVPISVTADAAFLMPGRACERVDTWWHATFQGKPVIGVALRPWGDMSWRGVTTALGALAGACGATLLYIPMQPAVDLPVARRLAASTDAPGVVFEYSDTPWETADAVSRCTFLVGMRLHSLIFAVNAGVPAYGLSYDPKVVSFCASAGLPTPLSVSTIVANELSAQLHTAWKVREPLQAKIQERIPALRAAAQRNIDVLVELLQRGGPPLSADHHKGGYS